MDNGEEIPGLNEDWSFAGAKLFEWMAGFITMMLASELFFDSAGKAMPLLVAIMFMTTFFLASIRKLFPDEERGLRNMCMVACGFAPPGIPKPAKIQPLWSGSPMREINQESTFKKLGLDEIFRTGQLEDED